MPEGWEGKAKELKAFQRAREIKTVCDLLRLIVLYLTSGKSFAGTSAITRIERAGLNKIAVWKRIQHRAAWLEWLCEHVCRNAGMLFEKPAWLAGKTVSWTQSEYNKYIIVATSLGEAKASAGQILELYRMRWQIESNRRFAAFKRLKSLFHYGDIPVKLDERAKAWFYGKLLLAALTETLVNNGRFSPGKQ